MKKSCERLNGRWGNHPNENPHRATQWVIYRYCGTMDEKYDCQKK